MINRYSRTGMILAAAMLYGGPILSGLAGHRLSVLPVFAALFLLYVAALRKPDMTTPAGWAGLVLMSSIQLGLVGLAYGLGLLLAKVFAPVAAPLWPPLALSAVAAGWCVWIFRDGAEMDVMLDGALAAISTLEQDAGAPGARRWPQPEGEVTKAVNRAATALRATPELSIGHIDPIVQDLEQAAGVAAFDPFYDLAGRGEPAIDLGLMRFIASPKIMRELVNRGEGGLGPMLLLGSADGAVRHEAIGRVIDLIDAGAPKDQLPPADVIRDLPKAFPEDNFDLLLALLSR